MNAPAAKKVLAVLGSPKGKGNGYKAARQLEAAMQRLGPVEFTWLFLKDARLEQCTGCFACVRYGEERCPLKDGRAELERQIEAHDGLVLVSPGYVQDVSALMKNFIDRMAYTHHRPRFFDKKLLLLANGGAGLPRVLSTLRMALGGPQIVDELAILALPWPMSDRALAKNERAIARGAGKLYAALGTGRPASPSFNDYVGFRFFKTTSADTREWLPADYEWYREKDEYYYPARIALWKRAGAAVVTRLVLALMKDLGPRPGAAGKDAHA